jgi:hypothetical protein
MDVRTGGIAAGGDNVRAMPAAVAGSGGAVPRNTDVAVGGGGSNDWSAARMTASGAGTGGAADAADGGAAVLVCPVGREPPPGVVADCHRPGGEGGAAGGAAGG